MCSYDSKDGIWDPDVKVYAQARYVDGAFQTKVWTKGGHKGYCDGRNSGWVDGLTASVSYDKGDEKCRGTSTSTKNGIAISGYCSTDAQGW